MEVERCIRIIKVMRIRNDGLAPTFVFIRNKHLFKKDGKACSYRTFPVLEEKDFVEAIFKSDSVCRI